MVCLLHVTIHCLFCFWWRVGASTAWSEKKDFAKIYVNFSKLPPNNNWFSFLYMIRVSINGVVKYFILEKAVLYSE